MDLEDTTLRDATLGDAGRALLIWGGIAAFPIYRGFSAGHQVGTGQPFPTDPLTIGAGLGGGIAALLLRENSGLVPIKLSKPAASVLGAALGYTLEAVGFAAGYAVGKY